MSEATEQKLEVSEEGLGQQGDGQNINLSTTSAPPGDDDDDDEPSTGGKQQKERRKIEIKFIQDKSRRHITFSKRKAGIMKKAYELSVLTGTQVLLLVVSETGLVYTFTTPKLQPLVTKSEGKNLIQACLNAPEEGLGDDQGDQSDDNSQEQSPEQSPAPPQPHEHPGVTAAQQQQQQQQQQAAAAAAAHRHAQQVQVQQLPPGAHLPQHGMPYPGAGHPHGGMPLPPQSFSDPNVYQQYFSNMQNGNIPNQQQYQ
ncbi:transcription factor of morphogenesis Mcm1p [[Candida] anglica]|uniref:Transcription factor of morphogenesis Mcm1p n=1 Tax=[Candida] anglica TaxID=148631 RepID=A0ABP0EE57_9ASCO